MDSSHKVDLEPHLVIIEYMWRHQYTHKDILYVLKNCYHAKIAIRTLQRRMKTWGMTKVARESLETVEKEVDEQVDEEMVA